MTTFDWEQLARKVGSVQENTALGPYSERGGTEIGLKAIEEILGRDFIRETVDHQVAGGRGSEVARSVLITIRAPSAMERCYEIYKSEADIETRIYAMWLLAYISDYRIVPWLFDFLDDAYEGFNVIAVVAMDQLLFVGHQAPPDDFARLIEKAENHPSQRVREQLADLRVRERYERDWV